MKAVKALFNAPGGIHPAYHKDLSAEQPIVVMPLPAKLVVSMSQHLGKPATPTVKKGDTVLRGQVIGESAGFISATVHAPTSGKVTLVSQVATAAGPRATAITIEPDNEDRWIEGITPCPDWRALDKRTIVDKIAAAGITGMGGAGFPTHVKVSPPPETTIDTLILNGAECEPYLTADYRLMVERAADIWEGALIIARALEASHIRVAIEDNKPAAIAAMKDAIPDEAPDAQVVILKTEYPQGAEKQQIFAVTGREVPSGGLPLNVGVVVENVGTTLAVWDAVVNGQPLTERVTTVTGHPVAKPGNVLARIGTLGADLVEFCGGATGPIAKIISGGPMMGFAQPDMNGPTTKTTSGLLLLGPESVHAYESMPCIGCGRCVGVCPMNLMPSELSQFLEAEDYETAEAYNVMDCIECGCCAFECPAHRPLVQHMRRGKAQVMMNRRKG